MKKKNLLKYFQKLNILKRKVKKKMTVVSIVNFINKSQ